MFIGSSVSYYRIKKVAILCSCRLPTQRIVPTLDTSTPLFLNTVIKANLSLFKPGALDSYRYLGFFAPPLYDLPPCIRAASDRTVLQGIPFSIG